jgi:hypothetical protein
MAASVNRGRSGRPLAAETADAAWPYGRSTRTISTTRSGRLHVSAIATARRRSRGGRLVRKAVAPAGHGELSRERRSAPHALLDRSFGLNACSSEGGVGSVFSVVEHRVIIDTLLVPGGAGYVASPACDARVAAGLMPTPPVYGSLRHRALLVWGERGGDDDGSQGGRRRPVAARSKRWRRRAGPGAKRRMPAKRKRSV